MIDFIQWLYFRDFGETISKTKIERAYAEWKNIPANENEQSTSDLPK